SEPVLCAARRALNGGDPACLAEGELLCTTEVVATAEAKRALVRPGRLAGELGSAPAAPPPRAAGAPRRAPRRGRLARAAGRARSARCRSAGVRAGRSLELPRARAAPRAP